MKNNLMRLVGDNEKIIYSGKPDKKCYVYEGLFGPQFFVSLVWVILGIFMYKEITHVDLHRGIFDNLFGVGDVVCTMNKLSSNILGVSGKGRVVINSFSGYEEIYDAIKKLMSYAYKYPM